MPPDDLTLRSALEHTLLAQGADATALPGATIRASAPDTWSGVPFGPPETQPVDLELEEPLARGGMGWIRRGRQRSLDRDVAVKVLLPDRRGGAAAHALVREARLAARLEHPNIVPVHGLLLSPEQGPMMVMKRVEATSWAELLRDPWHEGWGETPGDPLERNLQVLAQVCRAVHFAHSRGVLHLDIKPSNVMVSAFGEATLIDWGIALDVTEPRPGRLMGTPSCMAPEMTHTEGVLDPRTDVYLLGATLHRVVTGEPRHPAGSVVEAMLLARRCRPARYGPDVPVELGVICNRACACEPDLRFPDAMAFHAALQRYLRQRGAARLAESARNELLALQRAVVEPMPDPHTQALRVHRLYSASRFGFEQALREWSSNPVARDGLRETVQAMCRHAIDVGDVDSAMALLGELDSPPRGLVVDVRRAREALRARDRAQAALDELRAQQRVYGLDWRRSAVTLLNGAVTSGALLLASTRVRDAGMQVSLEGNLLFAAGWSLLIVVGILPFRGALLDNRAYGRFMLALVLVGPLMVLNRVVAGVLGSDFATVLAADCLIACAVSCALAVALDRAFRATAVIAVLGTLVAMTHLERALDVLAMAYLLNALVLAWVVRPRTQAVGPSTAAAMGLVEGA